MVRRLVGEDRELRVEEAEIDPLAAPRPRPLRQSRLDRDHAVKPGEDVGIGHAGLLRRAVRLAGQVHDAAHRLDDEIVAGPVRLGTVLAESGDRGVDHPRIAGGDCRVVEAVLHQTAALEVLDHHVGAGRQPSRQREIAGLAEVERDAALAPVAGMEIRRRAVGGEGRPPAAGLVARRALDLDHVRAQIRERLADPRTREHPGEFQHLQSGERSFRHRVPPRQAAIWRDAARRGQGRYFRGAALPAPGGCHTSGRCGTRSTASWGMTMSPS